MARLRVTTTNNFDFKKQLQEFITYRNNLTKIIGNEAVNFYKKSFTRQGFIDEGGVEKWKPRKERGKRKSKRAIGVKTGRLRRSPRITKLSIMQVDVGSDVPYAKPFNEGAVIRTTARVRAHLRRGRKGGRHTVKYHTREMNTTIPSRRFMGKSAFFNKRIKMQVNHRMTKIFNAR